MLCLKLLQFSELFLHPRLGSGPGRLPRSEGLDLEPAQIQKNVLFPTQTNLVFFLLQAASQQALASAGDAPLLLVCSSWPSEDGLRP